jgi:hypothetical protein
MIDTDKYERHTPAPWKASHDVLEYGHIVNDTGWRVYVGEHEKRAEICNHTFAHDELSEANARLIADAPLLLEAYKQLREWIEQAVDVWENCNHEDRTDWFNNFCEVMKND